MQAMTLQAEPEGQHGDARSPSVLPPLVRGHPNARLRREKSPARESQRRLGHESHVPAWAVLHEPRKVTGENGIPSDSALDSPLCPLPSTTSVSAGLSAIMPAGLPALSCPSPASRSSPSPGCRQRVVRRTGQRRAARPVRAGKPQPLVMDINTAAPDYGLHLPACSRAPWRKPRKPLTACPRASASPTGSDAPAGQSCAPAYGTGKSDKYCPAAGQCSFPCPRKDCHGLSVPGKSCGDRLPFSAERKTNRKRLENRSAQKRRSITAERQTAVYPPLKHRHAHRLMVNYFRFPLGGTAGVLVLTPRGAAGSFDRQRP